MLLINVRWLIVLIRITSLSDPVFKIITERYEHQVSALVGLPTVYLLPQRHLGFPQRNTHPA